MRPNWRSFKELIVFKSVVMRTVACCCFPTILPKLGGVYRLPVVRDSQDYAYPVEHRWIDFRDCGGDSGIGEEALRNISIIRRPRALRNNVDCQS